MVMIEQAIASTLFSKNVERTTIDKLLSKEEANEIKELISKNKLNRSDLLRLLYLLNGTESKMLNYGTYDRYIILKFFVWIREFVKVCELLYDYQDDLKRKESFCHECEGYVNKDKIENHEKLKDCKCPTPKVEFVLSETTRKLLDNNERLAEHNAKFLIDLYLNIARTSLSIGATGFMEILKNKFEFNYGNGQNSLGSTDPKGANILTTR
jgi:hypothetical protein